MNPALKKNIFAPVIPQFMAHSVDPRQTTRAFAYDFWMKASNPMVTFIKTIDVTRIVRISKKKGLKFNMLLDWYIGKAAEPIKEFYLLPVGKELIQYESLAVNTIVKNKTGEVSSCDILFYENLEEFNNEYCKYSDNDYALKLSRHGFELLLGEFADCKIGRTAGLTNVEFVEAVNNLIQERRDRDFNLGRMRYEVMELEQRNQGLNLVRRISSIVDNPIDRILFYYICHNLFEGSTYLDSSLKAVFGDQKKIMEESVLWQNEEHPLQVYGLVELGEESFFGGNKIELTEDGMEIFLEENAEKFKKKDKTNDILSVDKIKAKNLYYSDKLDSQISFLRDSLQEDAFSKLQERLEEQALPVGVAAIFYGSPGTGKTETVYQLAKATGRDVMQVDISEMKTCWYGESQKLVKGVFTKYERLCRKNKKLPILLFNEADAIFSKRLEAKGSSVDQTENAIQNIILEQMEKLKGILIATTNLESSLDPAFERRFLFKLQFERPSVEAKKHIWMDKLGDLSETDAAILAGNYNLSGGEIDNVTRKVTMNKVLTGEAYTLDYLKELCEQEKFTNQRAVIGF